MVATLHHLFTFRYHARFGEAGSEREVCRVFAGVSADPPRPNPTEIAAVRWIAPADLDRELAARPRDFTPWFALEWPRVRTLLPEALPELP